MSLRSFNKSIKSGNFVRVMRMKKLLFLIAVFLLFSINLSLVESVEVPENYPIDVEFDIKNGTAGEGRTARKKAKENLQFHDRII